MSLATRLISPSSEGGRVVVRLWIFADTAAALGG
jgi:hypothetical protein